jgi:hypothetical protein
MVLILPCASRPEMMMRGGGGGGGREGGGGERSLRSLHFSQRGEDGIIRRSYKVSQRVSPLIISGRSVISGEGQGHGDTMPCGRKHSSRPIL